jgi:phosphohistidine phosphatase
MRLALMRHAQAYPSAPSGRDSDRSITETGKFEASEAREWLRKNGFQVTHVRCSTALRTRQTLDILGQDRAVILPDPAAFEFRQSLFEPTVEGLMQAAAEISGDGLVLVLSHNPGVTNAVNWCLPEREAVGDLRTSAIVVIEFDQWLPGVTHSGQGRLVAAYEG